MSEYNYNEKYFEQIDSEDKAYWLGFLYADGYIEPIYRKEKIKAMRIEIGLSSCDKYHLIKFINDIESNVPITDRDIKVNGSICKTSRVRINNTKMCRDLITIGCTTKKSLTLKFPSTDIIPHNLLRHFIRGYFDGDGCISYSERNYIDKRNNKEYVQKNIVSSIVGTKNFLSSIILQLNEYNINFKLNEKSNCGNASEIRLTKHNDLLNLYIYLYSNASICLSRKKDKFNYALNKLNIEIPATCL